MGVRVIDEGQLINDRYSFKEYLRTLTRSTSNTVVILKFYSTTCNHCITATKILKDKLPILGLKKDVILININTDYFGDLASAFRVRGVPHVMNVTNEGYPDYQVVGANRAELDMFIRMLGE